jgi:cutinase
LSPGPLPGIGPLFAEKTIDLCVANDPICSDGWDWGAHSAYIQTGMVNQAATFAANRI